jgi:hypothetical protein
MGKEMFAVVDARARRHDIAIDERIVEIGTAQRVARRADPAQSPEPSGESGRRDRAGDIGGFAVLRAKSL